MARIRKIRTKLGRMRKEVEWVVYPSSRTSDDGRILIQSNKRIALFKDDGTNTGMLSKHCPNGAYFLHLNPVAGARVVDIPQEVIDMALAAQPRSGDTIHGVVRIA